MFLSSCENSKYTRINRISQRFWFSGICFSLISSVSALVRLRAQGRRLALSRSVNSTSNTLSDAEKNTGSEADRRAQGQAMLKERAVTLSQIVQDSMDFWIPANNLGYSNLNDGVIGALGVMTSYMALQQQWLKVNAAAPGPKSA